MKERDARILHAKWVDRADIQRTAHMQRQRQRLISTTIKLICAIGETQKRNLQSKYSEKVGFGHEHIDGNQLSGKI